MLPYLAHRKTTNMLATYFLCMLTHKGFNNDARHKVQERERERGGEGDDDAHNYVTWRNVVAC